MVEKLTFLSDCWIILNFGPSWREYFSLQNDSLQAKIEVKSNEISQKHQNPNKGLKKTDSEERGEVLKPILCIKELDPFEHWRLLNKLN